MVWINGRLKEVRGEGLVIEVHTQPFGSRCFLVTENDLTLLPQEINGYVAVRVRGRRLSRDKSNRRVFVYLQGQSLSTGRPNPRLWLDADLVQGA